MATQVSCVLMRDSRLSSLVFCHADGAQSLEYSHWFFLDASAERLRMELEPELRHMSSRRIVHWPLKGAEISPASSLRNETILY